MRTVTRHEDDVGPVLVWLATAYAAAFLSAYVVEWTLRNLGYTATRSVKIVGGGAVSYVPMTTAEYWSGFASVVVLLLVLSGWYYRNWKRGEE